MSLGYLQVHQNPHAAVRTDRRRYWGYPTRRAAVQVIVVHTAESIPDYSPPVDAGAENVANWLARTVPHPASYHEVGDSDSWVLLLPDEATAFGCRGFNSNGWHYSFATQAHRWPGKPDSWRDPALRIAADRCALRARTFDIPVRRITLAQARAGVKGFAAHGDLDPTRRTDPGAGFPWDRFLALVEQRLRPAPSPVPVPLPRWQEEDLVFNPFLVRNRQSNAVQLIIPDASTATGRRPIRLYEDLDKAEARFGPTVPLRHDEYTTVIATE